MIEHLLYIYLISIIFSFILYIGVLVTLLVYQHYVCYGTHIHTDAQTERQRYFFVDVREKELKKFNLLFHWMKFTKSTAEDIRIETIT